VSLALSKHCGRIVGKQDVTPFWGYFRAGLTVLMSGKPKGPSFPPNVYTSSSDRTPDPATNISPNSYPVCRSREIRAHSLWRFDIRHHKRHTELNAGTPTTATVSRRHDVELGKEVRGIGTAVLKQPNDQLLFLTVRGRKSAVAIIHICCRSLLKRRCER
jgi:hypothetical protein